MSLTLGAINWIGKEVYILNDTNDILLKKVDLSPTSGIIEDNKKITNNQLIKFDKYYQSDQQASYKQPYQNIAAMSLSSSKFNANFNNIASNNNEKLFPSFPLTPPPLIYPSELNSFQKLNQFSNLDSKNAQSYE